MDLWFDFIVIFMWKLEPLNWRHLQVHHKSTDESQYKLKEWHIFKKVLSWLPWQEDKKLTK